MRSTIVAALAACALATSVGAQTDTVRPVRDTTKIVQVANGDVALSRAPILGVFDTEGQPIEGVLVRDTLGNEARTTATGTVTLGYMVPVLGYYFIEIRKNGYKPLNLKVRVDSLSDRTEVLESAPLGKVDTSEALMLPAMLAIAPGTAAWNMRCGSSSGCIRPGVLQDSSYQFKTIGEALWTNKIDISKAYNVHGQNCVPQILLNGGMKSVIGLDAPARTITAVEFYATNLTTPMQFERKDGKDCGTLVLWTFAHP